VVGVPGGGGFEPPQAVGVGPFRRTVRPSRAAGRDPGDAEISRDPSATRFRSASVCFHRDSASAGRLRGPVCAGTGPAIQDVALGRVEVGAAAEEVQRHGGRPRSSSSRPRCAALLVRRWSAITGRGRPRLVGFPCASRNSASLHANRRSPGRFVERFEVPPPRPPVPAPQGSFAPVPAGWAVSGPFPRLRRPPRIPASAKPVAPGFRRGSPTLSPTGALSYTSAPVGSPRSTAPHVRGTRRPDVRGVGVVVGDEAEKSGSRRELPNLARTSARSRATASGTSAGGRPRRGARGGGGVAVRRAAGRQEVRLRALGQVRGTGRDGSGTRGVGIGGAGPC